VSCVPRRSFASAERRLPDEGFGRHLSGVTVAHGDRGDVAKLMHSDRPVLGEGLVDPADLFAAIVERFHWFLLWVKEIPYLGSNSPRRAHEPWFE
jgi:hypothetical protein